MNSESKPLLQIENLKTYYYADEGVTRSVDGVTLSVPAGKTVCVVGESGCGKSVTARSILGLVDTPGKIVDGSIRWRSGAKCGEQPAASAPKKRDREVGGDEGEYIDLVKLGPRSERMRQIRGNEISMIFQEPMASLSPMYTIGQHLVEAMRLHRKISEKDAWARGVEMLRSVGIPRPEQRMNNYSFQMSGGMCQRAMIAIALACDPALLIADEPTTALDVTTQARIIELLADVQERTGMAMLFITHDLGVVAEIADEVAVMYLGTVVEQGAVYDIFHRPQHPYTKALLASVPTMGGGPRQALRTIRGQVPHPLNRPQGCPFHPRCDSMIEGICDVSVPQETLLERSRVSCFLYDEDGESNEATRVAREVVGK